MSRTRMTRAPTSPRPARERRSRPSGPRSDMARLLVAAGAQSYTRVSHPGERLDGVKPDVELVAGVLTNEFGYTRSWIDKDSHDLDLPVETLRRGLSGWLAAPER